MREEKPMVDETMPEMAKPPKGKKRFWITWELNTRDYAPKTCRQVEDCNSEAQWKLIPLKEGILGWWVSRIEGEQVFLCGAVDAINFWGARALIREEWPSISGWGQYHELAFLPNQERFPLANWMRIRFCMKPDSLPNLWWMKWIQTGRQRGRKRPDLLPRREILGSWQETREEEEPIFSAVIHAPSANHARSIICSEWGGNNQWLQSIPCLQSYEELAALYPMGEWMEERFLGLDPSPLRIETQIPDPSPEEKDDTEEDDTESANSPEEKDDTAPSTREDEEAYQEIIDRASSPQGSGLVVRPWLTLLSFRMQAVVLSALRGCDHTRKYDPSKFIHWALRADVLLPADPAYNMLDPKGYMGYHPDLHRFVREFLADLDHYPIHYVTHLAHAAEILGYFHPEEETASFWDGIYHRILGELHFQPERKDQCLDRLRDRPDELEDPT